MKKIFYFLLITLIALIFISAKNKNRPFKEKRLRMVKNQIQLRGIKDKDVIYAMKTVPRHKFVPDKYKNLAYMDRPLPIGYGQTISQPYIVALMTSLLDVKKEDKILEIGTGSGYQAAILSRIASKVYSVEIIKELHQKSTAIFKNLKYNNVKTLHADGYYGWNKYAPYDGIIVTCASELIPPPLIKQLKIGGKMCIPVGPPFRIQRLLLIKKTSPEKYKTEVITSVRFVPMLRKRK